MHWALEMIACMCVCTCDLEVVSQPWGTGETTLILRRQPTNDSQLKSLRSCRSDSFWVIKTPTLTQTTSGCLEVMIPFFGKVILVITSRAQQLLLCFVSQVRRQQWEKGWLLRKDIRLSSSELSTAQNLRRVFWLWYHQSIAFWEWFSLFFDFLAVHFQLKMLFDRENQLYFANLGDNIMPSLGVAANQDWQSVVSFFENNFIEECDCYTECYCPYLMYTIWWI